MEDLRPSWDLLGRLWGVSGSSWARRGVLEPLGAVLGCLGLSWPGLGVLLGVWGSFWTRLGRVFGSLWVILGQSWSLLGRSWAVLGPFGPLLERLGGYKIDPKIDPKTDPKPGRIPSHKKWPKHYACRCFRAGEDLTGLRSGHPKLLSKGLSM